MQTNFNSEQAQNQLKNLQQSIEVKDSKRQGRRENLVSELEKKMDNMVLDKKEETKGKDMHSHDRDRYMSESPRKIVSDDDDYGTKRRRRSDSAARYKDFRRRFGNDPLPKRDLERTDNFPPDIDAF